MLPAENKVNLNTGRIISESQGQANRIKFKEIRRPLKNTTTTAARKLQSIKEDLVIC